MISGYGDQSTAGIILHVSCFTNAASIALNASRAPYVLYMQLQHQVTHRNGAIKHIFYTNQIHGGSSADCSLFILSLHPLALHLAVKILLQIFLYEDLSTLTLTLRICRLYFPQNANQDRTLLRNQYY